MTDEHEGSPTTSALLEKQRALIHRIEEGLLPGWQKHLEENPDSKTWIYEQLQRATDAMARADAFNHENALRSFQRGWARVNNHLAEEYRLSVKPEEWELRYIKWMKNVLYIHFSSPKGDFYLLPRRPRNKPPFDHWYTVDEMIEMLRRPAVAAVVQMAQGLPSRDRSPLPKGKEVHLVFDATVSPPKIVYRWNPRAFYERSKS